MTLERFADLLTEMERTGKMRSGIPTIEPSKPWSSLARQLTHR